jgi:hypothetical protein
MLVQKETTSSTIQRSPSLRIPCAGGAGNDDNHNHPPACISYPDDSQHRRDEAACLRDRLTTLLDAIDMPRVGGPLFEEEGDLGEAGNEQNSVPPLAYQDPYIAGADGNLLITTWGHIWQRPASWEGGQHHA